MIELIQKIINKLTKPIQNNLSSNIIINLKNESVAQKTLMQQYRIMASNNLIGKLSFSDVGFRKFSQFEEDGILLFLFSLISPVSKVCVEICAANGKECNTTNLIINHGWWGHLFDGGEKNVADGNAFFKSHSDTCWVPPKFTQAWITAENVNDIILKSGASGPIGLLSLDIDGMDYWVWEAITVIEPQVVVCEIHNLIPHDQALTVPYDPKFIWESDDYRGASLAAMCKLGKKKGYRLVGSHRLGFNVFFVKNGVGEEYFPEVDPESCLKDPFTLETQKRRWPAAKKKNWVKV